MKEVKREIKDSKFIDVNYNSIESILRKIFKKEESVSFNYDILPGKLVLSLEDNGEVKFKLILSLEDIDKDEILYKLTVEVIFPYNGKEDIFEHVNKKNIEKPSKNIAVIDEDFLKTIQRTSSSVFVAPIKENHLGFIIAQCIKEIFE